MRAGTGVGNWWIAGSIIVRKMARDERLSSFDAVSRCWATLVGHGPCAGVRLRANAIAHIGIAGGGFLSCGLSRAAVIAGL